MSTVLNQIVAKFEEYVANLIDMADMPAEDKEALKAHLKATEEILVRNGQSELHDFLSGITGAILAKF